jgi:hypothetical protein
MIGRTLCKAPTVPAKSRAYYKEHIIVGKHPYYAVDPREGGKPEWVRQLYIDHLLPLIELLDAGYTEGLDFVAQLTLYDAANNDYCRLHSDTQDIAPQIIVAMGSFEGGDLVVHGPDAEQQKGLKQQHQQHQQQQQQQRALRNRSSRKRSPRLHAPANWLI